jgi:hypothetical protein
MLRHPAPPHYREPGLDAFRIVAQAYGDDNPLWSDRGYAAKTRWREPVARGAAPWAGCCSTGPASSTR